MGKGDLKTKRGKIVNKSYGVRRPKKANKPSTDTTK
ncbi:MULTISPECIES: 30S ribosomal protein THX [Myroides]|nr:30S ribosomal protein THX [Myroides phaeus]